jgi:hypothetical protein
MIKVKLRKRMANMFDMNWQDNDVYKMNDIPEDENYFDYYKLNDSEFFAYSKQNEKFWKVNIETKKYSAQDCKELIPQAKKITQYQFETQVGTINYYNMINSIGR